MVDFYSKCREIYHSHGLFGYIMAVFEYGVFLKVIIYLNGTFVLFQYRKYMSRGTLFISMLVYQRVHCFRLSYLGAEDICLSHNHAPTMQL